ncbi:MAG: hypothetical protein NDI61_08375 [Bdellovibrionaceae bacterium]|nr:hypothetical protein [Pseudobdellovibrionaceae bacterium]
MSERKYIGLSWAILMTALFVSEVATARPEYAVRHGINRCTACHVSPYGGGIRTVNGKLYGSRGFQTGPLSKQDLFQFDYRAEFLRAQNGDRKRQGAMLMTANPAAHLPVMKVEDGGAETSVNVTYALGEVDLGLRDAYILIRPVGESRSAASDFVLGRVIAPFGLATDEHRTFTRIATNTSVNKYEMGGGISGDPLETLHYDLFVSDGFQAKGALPSREATWAVIANVRTMPFTGPLAIGASHSRHGGTIADDQDLTATSLYGVLSLDRLIPGFINGSFQAEWVTARGWNNSNFNGGMSNFFPAGGGSAEYTSWAAALSDKTSESIYGLLNWDMTETWTAQLKLDAYMPNNEFRGDVFYRYSGGLRMRLMSNLTTILRYEDSTLTRPGMGDTSSVPGIGQNYLAFLHVWF